MGLDIGNDGGDWLPWVKYNANAGRWYLKDNVEVTDPVFVVDFVNIKTGWFYFSTGKAPEKVFDSSLADRATKPDRTYTDDKGKVRDCFTRGFQVNLFSDASFGGVVEMSANSAALNNTIKELYGLYEASEEGKAGKLPVITFLGSDPVQNNYGKTTYVPKFEITNWVYRPAQFDTPVEAAPIPAPVALPTAATGSGGVQATPVAAPVAVAVTGISEF